MRKILFRGKPSNALSDEEWLFGLLVKQLDLDGTDELHIQTWERDKEGVSSRVLGVIPGTVGQYTGLKDKNGKRIFEGDILKSAACWLQLPQNAVVAFKDGSFGFTWERGSVKVFEAFPSVCNIEYEVIGNIHDNPELMKGE